MAVGVNPVIARQFGECEADHISHRAGWEDS
jgi:hypothetical protein